MSPAIIHTCDICKRGMRDEADLNIDGTSFCDDCGMEIFKALRAPTATAIELIRLRKRLEKEAGNDKG